ARKLGLNKDVLQIARRDNEEQSLEIAEMLVRSAAVEVVVIESVAALVPRSGIGGDMGDSFVGLQARLMSQALRKLSGTISKSKTTAIFINQLREKIGVMFGNPEVTPGGRALKFYTSNRLDIRKGKSLKKGEEVIGNRVKVKCLSPLSGTTFSLPGRLYLGDREGTGSSKPSRNDLLSFGIF
ncbi:recombination protein RecA, partial [Candidatus Hakubella thermalkaliphila]